MHAQIALVLRAFLAEQTHHLAVKLVDLRKAFKRILLELQQCRRYTGTVFVVLVFAITHVEFFGHGSWIFGQRIRINQAVDEFVDTHFVARDFGRHAQHFGYRGRAGRNRHHHVFEAVFNPLGDFDFAFAGQQFDGTHFTHIHADRVGRATEFRVDRRQGLLGLLFNFSLINMAGDRVGEQQLFGRRCFIKHLDAHVIEGGDDGFNLLGVNQIIGQMVVDFGVGQVAAFFAQRDQIFQAQAARVHVQRRGGRWHDLMHALAFAPALYRLGRSGRNGLRGGRLNFGFGDGGGSNNRLCNGFRFGVTWRLYRRCLGLADSDYFRWFFADDGFGYRFAGLLDGRSLLDRLDRLDRLGHL